MASRSRLGKGLGALFPAIPGEEAEDHQQEPSQQSTLNIPETKEQKSDAQQRNTKSDSQAHVSRETSSVGSLESSQADAQELRNKAKAQSRRASTKKVHTEKRKSMPGFEELSHPSDVFFGVSRETSKSNEKLDAKSTAPALATKKTESQHKDSTSVTVDEELSELHPISGGYLAEIDVNDIEANAQQPRTIFDEEELLELSHSITEVGVLQPIVVRKKQSTGDSQSADTSYELIMGERRWRASQLAALPTIPAIVKTTADDDMLRDALLENLHRVALNPLEEAAAYQQMIDEFGLTQAELSHSVSKSRPQVANMLRLLQLPGNVQKKVASGVLSAGHARALLGLQSPEDMEIIANRVISEGLSVRSTEEIVALKTRSSSQKIRKQNSKPSPWDDSPVMHNLENHFETKINIKGNDKHGKIEITFSSPEDMSRIVNLMLGGDTSQNADPTGEWV
jgi:ParB family chromosome partitioning protein